MENTNERKKTLKWYECPDCGNWFSSYGYQKRVICPHCYERRTGKKLGGNTEKAQLQRKINIEKRKAEKEAAKAAAEQAAAIAAQKQQQQPKPKAEGSFLDRFLNKTIL